MNMGDIRDLFGISAGLSTPILIYIAWLVWRVYDNHLPHLQTGLDKIDKRLARLEGRQEERDHDVTRGIRQV